MAKIESSDVLETALDSVTGNRQKQNGDKSKNHQNIANMWTAYLTNEFGERCYMSASLLMSNTIYFDTFDDVGHLREFHQHLPKLVRPGGM